MTDKMTQVKEFKKVKSVREVKATLYGQEKQVDDSLVGLMRKLAERRDYWKQKHKGKETVLNWSFTPFTSKNQTPYEFANCMGGLTNRKTLTPAVEEARKLGFKFRVGTSSDTSTIAQVLTLGDRRLKHPNGELIADFDNRYLSFKCSFVIPKSIKSHGNT